SSGTYSTAFSGPLSGINDSGLMVGSYTGGGNSGYGSGFLLNNHTYSTIDVPGDFYSRANGINNSGVVVGFDITNYSFGATGIYHGFSYSGGSYTTVDDPNVAAYNGVGQL